MEEIIIINITLILIVIAKSINILQQIFFFFGMCTFFERKQLLIPMNS